MKNRFTLFFVLMFLITYSVNASIYETNKIRISIDEETGILESIVTLHNDINWKTKPSKIYSNTNGMCEGKITIVPLQTTGQIKFDIELTNTSNTSQITYVTVPLLENIFPGGDIKELFYLYPKQGTVLSNMRYYHGTKYSGKFPHQFIDIFHSTYGGIYFMTEDSTNLEKDYWLEKTNREINTGCTYKISLEPNETIRLPSSYLGGHTGDWHDAVYAYKTLLKNWFQPYAPREKWFQEVFNLRQHFMYENYGDETYNRTTKEFSLNDEIQKDIQEFGGVDFCHIFDWSWTGEKMFPGKYNPQEFLGEKGWNNFLYEIKKIQNGGIKVGLYFEGYLFLEALDDGTQAWKNWQILKANGEPSYYWSENFYHQCPYVLEWQNYLAESCKKAIDWTNVDGVYLDELGFGWQEAYRCYNTNHGHEENTFIPAGEGKLLKNVSGKIQSNKVIYTEETPVDVNMQYQDGSFSYTIGSQFNAFNDSRINLTRFINPDFKNLHIINVDGEMGKPLDKLNIIFFNGEGLWLSGPISSYSWFPQETRDVIKRNYKILNKYKDAFSTLHPEPLVPTLKSRLYANMFPVENEIVWTLFNHSNSSFINEEVICVDHVEGATYYDAYNNYGLNPRIEDGKAYLKIEIGSGKIGCIVQKKKDITFIKEINHKLLVQIAPNPVSSELNILNSNSSDNYEIINSVGNKVKSFQGNRCRVDGIPPGIYILHNTSNFESITFIKTN